MCYGNFVHMQGWRIDRKIADAGGNAVMISDGDVLTLYIVLSVLAALLDYYSMDTGYLCGQHAACRI